MDEFEFYNKHYIRTRADGCITEGWSDGPWAGHRTPAEEDILLNDKGGYQFRLILDGALTEENPLLFTFDYMIPMYKWDGERVLRRSWDEIAAEKAEAQAEAERQERERIENATETVLLDMAADHEERLCLLELGITENI